jgi:hypothetical protein
MFSCDRFWFHLPFSARTCARIGIALLLLGVGVCVACAQTPAPKKPLLPVSVPHVPFSAMMKDSFIRPSSAAAFFAGPASVRTSTGIDYGVTPPHARGAWRITNWLVQETLGDDGLRAAKQGLSRAKHFGLKK